MFTTVNAQSLKLDVAATQFLLAHGCTVDGRPVEEVDSKQVGFDNRMEYCNRFCSSGEHRDW